MPILSFFPMQCMIKVFFIFFIITLNFTFAKLNAEIGDLNDKGIISIMYHRFEENKYPSTNIKLIDFKKHLDLVYEKDIYFINPSNIEKELNINQSKKKVLLTIDDGYSSFYNKAWPILKEKKIPFILFISTREVGKNGYMSWDEIREIHNSKIGIIGNHSHSHDYLIDFEKKKVKDDLLTSKKIFEEELGKNPIFFSYPFGEYSKYLKELVKQQGFKYAFGQHSGVIDNTKSYYELPRFPINEKYGTMKRFNSILNTLPFKFENIEPEEKYIINNNPPNVKIKLLENTYAVNKVNCFSNEEDKWRKSNIEIIDNQTIKVKLAGKFITERGRINCSLRNKNGEYHWLGIQFVIAEY